MSPKDSDVRARIERYRQLCEAGEAATVVEATRKALGDRHHLLVARGAEQCAERLLYDLEPSLLQAYARLLENPAKKDPSCAAKGAIARALVSLDSQDSGFFIAGMKYRQLEPVWGGTVDTAVDLRCSCAMGLVGTTHPRALIELVFLLHDPEPHARSGAARAIACTEPLPAEAVLRSKALAGDPEPEVVGDCLSGLLQLEADEAPAFVAGFLDNPHPAIRELAALALGESRLDIALEILRARWEEQPLKRDSDRVLLRAAALHRSEAAFDWLCAVAADGDKTSARLVVQELAVYRVNDGLRERLTEVVAERGDGVLQETFERAWKRARD
ncbi:MAG: hypothetical protein LJE70_13565 [Chromatiaceae bacterium]|jgi:hypothetical protein|nr:hypothetical protein [Chromatiaceae bacterium]